MKIHIVKSGDTLYELAQKYHIELDKLIASNPHIVNPDQIEVGMKVKIPTAPVAMAPAEGTYTFKHIVKQGDTLWKLSKAWDVPLSAMVAANQQLKNPNVLLTGEVVYIPKIGSEAAEPEAPAAVVAHEPEHEIVPGFAEPATYGAVPTTPGAVPEASHQAWEAAVPEAYPAAEWHGMHAAWPPSAPGLQPGFPPEPMEAPLHSPDGAADAGMDHEPHTMHMPHMPQLPQAPLLAEPFGGVHDWGQPAVHPFGGVHDWEQPAVHPFAQADIPATEAFAVPGQPELPHVPPQPFETYASPYGSYPILGGPPPYEQAHAPHPYGGGHGCCSGPQLDVPAVWGYGPGSMPYAVPLQAPLPEYAHGGMPVPVDVDPAFAHSGGWTGYPNMQSYAMLPPLPNPLTALAFPHQAAYPMDQAPYAPYGGVPGGQHDAYTSAADWEGAKLEEKEEEIDLTIDEDKAGVKAKAVSVQARKKSKPQSPRDRLSEYLRSSSRHRMPEYSDSRQNVPWINV